MALDPLPASPALNGRLRWFDRHAEAVARDDFWAPTVLRRASDANMPRVGNGFTNLTAAVSGTLMLYGGGILIPGEPVVGLTFYSGNTASVTLTHSWACLVDQNLNVLAKSADNTTAEWTNAGTARNFPITYTPPGADLVPVYFGLVIVAATVNNLRGVLSTQATGPSALTPILAASSTAGLTVPGDLGATAAALTVVTSLAYAHIGS